MRRKTNKWLQLVADCLVHLSRNNVKIVFSHDMVYLPDENIYTRGYWDDDDIKNPTLACTITENEQDWVPIFAHEYCHFCQWIDESDIWVQNKKINVQDINKILNNEPISEKNLNNYLNALRDIELDCEKRTVKLFKEYKIPIDIREYIKRANAYVWFYNHIKTYRRWYPKNDSPYLNKKIIDVCSSRFHKCYDVIPEPLATIFEQAYPSRKVNNII
jgi:hypothetical protein